ncbi:hypothetical protein BW716_07460 [[Flexibacter] sp. ATCC 35208]|nr:hypothetical protein BW716_07460 [[Flexibacter] sp. ATCC 35208]
MNKMRSLQKLLSVVALLPAVMAAAPLPTFFKVGHRGTRGMMPENTIPAMIRAIEDGANTLEFDVHITKDGQVVVYHDASFDPAYTTRPDGSEIQPSERGKYIFYQMNYSEIRPFRIGEKPYPNFPQQQRMRTYAPLLSEMIDSVEAYNEKHHKPPVYYLLEIKSSEKTDGKEQPAPKEYVEKLMEVKQLKKLKHRLLIQSFDMRPLQVLHRSYPKVTLGFLTGDKNVSFYQQLEGLGFLPTFYNPHFSLVTKELLDYCHSKGMKVVPWTVADLEDMKRLKAMGVDGIITDYPDRINKI